LPKRQIGGKINGTKMSKRKTILIVFFIFLLAFFAGNFIYPRYFNYGIDFLNSKIKEISREKIKVSLPHLMEIPFRLGSDLGESSFLFYDIDLTGVEEKDYPAIRQSLREKVGRRINSWQLIGLGGEEITLRMQETGGNYRLIIELPGIKDPSRAIQLIGEAPLLEFKEQRPEEETTQILEKRKELEGKSFEEIQKVENWQLALEDPYFIPTPLNGKYLEKAEVNLLGVTPNPIISLQFNGEGAKLFEELTSKNIGKRLAIYVDQTIISAPLVQEKISGGKAQISGDFTAASARELVANLNKGTLPVPITLVSQKVIEPILGQAFLGGLVRPGITGLLALFALMIIFYRWPGFLFSLSLLISSIFLFSLLKLASVVLTLSGLVAFILFVVIVVSNNLLIFSRLREEFSSGKSFSSSLNEGFSRTWLAIRHSNVVIIIFSLILFLGATGLFKSFALSLIIGIIFNLFSVVVITKFFLRVFAGTRLSNVKWLCGGK